MRPVYEKCSGCSACYLACPVRAIKMTENEKGFLQACIDENICIRCGKCERICENAKHALYDISRSGHFAAVSRDRSVLGKSSSGGLGFLLAESYIDSGLAACGVSYNSQAENAEHIFFTDGRQLSLTQGSKYLQSNNARAFEAALDHPGKAVIFGTPCQIAGFREVIRSRKDQDRFLLADLFCHGVPSTKLWRNHIAGIRKRRGIEGDIFPVFRKNKDYFLKFRKYFGWYNRDAFMMLFLMGRFLNRSCYSCPYRRNSSADIRIGDLMSEKYRELWYSPSCVCINTEKGADVFHALSDKIECYPIDYSEIDNIQEKPSFRDPEADDPKYALLNRADVTPEMLLGRRIWWNRLKSLIKIPLLKLGNISKKDSLYDVISRDR